MNLFYCITYLIGVGSILSGWHIISADFESTSGSNHSHDMLFLYLESLLSR